MEHYLDIFLRSFTEYAAYLKNEILFSYDYKPWWENYFYWLILLSVVVWSVELIVPWRKGQKTVRKDFWLDVFYMFFNFFLLSLIGYNAISNIGVELFNQFLGLFGLTNLVAINVASWPAWAQFGLMFILADFIQWNVHRLLHRVPWLWEFHKVHHSVKEMGFAAHLRFHWMETFVYKSIQYVPLAIIGFGLQDFFIMHMVTLLIGHLNHANLNIDYGPLRYVLNNPKMHIWHHVKQMPNQYPNGFNFGISLSIWDYIFGTALIPSDGRDIELGFDGDENFPQGFVGQAAYGLGGK
jgi:sterol desaturase/sphingolipid hydroxylase (fatty acid hydroxylase superfamily)